MASILDCHITSGILAVIVVVVVASVVLAYIIGAACVRAWINKSPKYMYCARCNQFLGSLNVGRPPHLVPGFQVPSYNRFSPNDFHDVPNFRVDVSKHDDRPPTGTFQRLGMRTSKSNRSSTFPNFLSPIQASPPDKITATSEMELLTPVPEAPMSKYVNQPGAVLSKPSTPKDPSSAARAGSLLKKTQQRSGKLGPPLAGANGRSAHTVTTEMLSQVGLGTACTAGDDSVFYQDGEGGDCRHLREVSKMSQVRILASPPPSKLQGVLISKTPANANKSHRNVESTSCEPKTSGPTKIKNRIRSSLRDKGQARHSVQSEGSGKSRRSLMSRKLKLFSDDRKPRNSRDTQYSPLVNQNHTTTEDSCGIRSDFSVEDQTYPYRDAISNNGDPRENSLVQEKPPKYPNELKPNNERTIAGNKITESEAKKVAKRGSPGNTGNISVSNLLVDIDIGGSPPPISPASQIRPEIAVDHCEAGAHHSCEANDGERFVQNDMSCHGHVMKNAAPTGQDLGTKLKVRSSSSARKEKAQYLGKRPGFTESDITSQSEDERPRTRITSLRRSHLAGMSQSEEDEPANRKERNNLHPSETPSHTPQFPVQNSKHVTTKRGTPTPSSLPICTPKFVTVRDRNNAPDTSNYPPNSWDSRNNSNLPPNSWDPASQDLVKSKPFDLSAGSGQVNLSISSCINNLSATAMDNSTPAEGNHTSSPHSSAHLAAFQPEDLSIPGLDTSLSESSPPLVQDGRYSQPLHNPMTQNLALANTTQNQSPQALPPLGNNAEKIGSNNSSNNLPCKSDTKYPTEIMGNLDNSAGSVSSQNQLLKLNHDSSKESQDTIRGVSLDSTSTLVPSPVSFNNRPQPEAFATRTPLVSKTSPSPKHSLIPRPIERNHQTRSMPPTTQWSRVQEHALPPSLPPLAPKTRIDVVVPTKAPSQSLQSPAQNIQQSESGTQLPNIRTQNVRSMPPVPQWSRVKEHALPPSLPPLALKSRIFSSEVANNTRGNIKPTPTKIGSNYVTDSPVDMLKQNFQPNALPPVRSMPPPPYLPRLNQHSLPPSLPPPHDALLQQVASLPPVPHWPRVKEHALPPSVPPSHDALLQQLQTLPPVPQWPPPPYLPPTVAKTRIPGFGIQRSFDKDERDRRMGIVPKERNGSASDIGRKNSRSSSTSSLPMYNDNPRPADSGDRRYPLTGGPGRPRSPAPGGPGRPRSPAPGRPGRPQSPAPGGPGRPLFPETGVPGQPRSPAPGGSGRPRSPETGRPGQPRSPETGGPVRAIIPQPNKSELVAGQSNSQVDFRSRSTTESSHPPSLMWDSYGSDPTFVPRRPEDLEDFTLSSESESNKVMREGQHMVYRSDGESVQNRNTQEAGIERQSRPVEETTKENQRSSYFQAGVRTRSQSR